MFIGYHFAIPLVPFSFTNVISSSPPLLHKIRQSSSEIVHFTTLPTFNFPELPSDSQYFQGPNFLALGKNSTTSPNSNPTLLPTISSNFPSMSCSLSSTPMLFTQFMGHPIFRTQDWNSQAEGVFASIYLSFSTSQKTLKKFQTNLISLQDQLESLGTMIL